MLTEDLEPWLIEINSSPSMARTTRVTADLVDLVLEDTVKGKAALYSTRPACVCGLFYFTAEHQFHQPFQIIPNRKCKNFLLYTTEVCYLITTFRCPSDILIMSCWLFTARWSMWPGNHLVPCVAELAGSCISIHAYWCHIDMRESGCRILQTWPHIGPDSRTWSRCPTDIETLSLGNTLQLCRVIIFYITDCTDWMNLFKTIPNRCYLIYHDHSAACSISSLGWL